MALQATPAMKERRLAVTSGDAQCWSHAMSTPSLKLDSEVSV
jgi:hypothetical protein